MLFNSLEFIIAFLPAVLLVYSALRLTGRALAAKIFLVLASLFFYGWWQVKYVPLMIGSIAVNYGLSLLFSRGPRLAKRALVLGIVFNLGLLGYFKYYNFFVGSALAVIGAPRAFVHIALPLAISFFTFQQIAYLIEAARDRRPAESFLDYCLFVLFFPHLIAGPITHHKEMLPQFKAMGARPLTAPFLTAGTAIFVLGLAKKVLIADTAAGFADPVFAAADGGQGVSALAAWLGALAYTFQLYFDFSGYSDMALGLGLLFGVRLPVNFASPYKSASIIAFWGRWHISLSTFLRNYLYIPLGGNRHGALRRYLNLFVTMAIGGLWHGAGWTFMGWGALHGCYLIVNHAWRHVTKNWSAGLRDGRLARLAGWAVTFIAAVFAWVLFRATSWQGAVTVVRGMLGLVPTAPLVPGLLTGPALLTVTACAALAFLAPSALELVGYPACVPGTEHETAPLRPLRHRIGGAALWLGIAAALVIARLPDPGIFLYFNF